MNHENGRPAHVDALFDALQHEPVPAPVESHLRGRLHEFRERLATDRQAPGRPSPGSQSSAHRARFTRRNIWGLVTAGLVTGGLAAALLLAVFVVTSGDRSAWGQVKQAVRSKPWIRSTLRGPNDQKLEIWVSFEKQTAATNSQLGLQYLDFGKQEVFRFDQKENAIYQTSIDAIDTEQLSTFETLLGALSKGKGPVTLPESPVKIVDQTQREITEGDKRWVEFEFQFEDPRRSPPEYRTTFRVDPETRLPHDMTEHFLVEDQTVSRKFEIDYPSEGPGDIYALGAPKAAALVDRRLPRDTRQLISSSIKAGKKTMEPYSAVVLVSVPWLDWKDIIEAYRVRRTAAGLQIEQANPDQLMELRGKVHRKELLRPEGADRLAWWKEQVGNLPFVILPGEWGSSRVVPDVVGYFSLPSEPASANLTVDPQPTTAPGGTTVFRLRVPQLPGSSAFWIAAADRDYMVMRWENSTDKVDKEWIHTTVIDKLEKSPQGRWYVVESRHGAVEHSGDELSAVNGVAPVATVVYRYLVDFE